MSSRNKYLVGKLRPQATVLRNSIQAVKQAVASKPVTATKLKARVRQIIKTAPDARLDYVEFFDPDNLLPARKVSRGNHMALAVFVGKTRLIDNAQL